MYDNLVRVGNSVLLLRTSSVPPYVITGIFQWLAILDTAAAEFEQAINKIKHINIYIYTVESRKFKAIGTKCFISKKIKVQIIGRHKKVYMAGENSAS